MPPYLVPSKASYDGDPFWLVLCRDPVKCGERWGSLGWGGGSRGMVMEVEGAWNLGLDGDVELHEGGYWDVSLCTGAAGSGGNGSSVGVDGTDSVEVNCVGVVSGSNSVGFVVVVVLDGFGLVLWSSLRMAL